MKTLLHFYWSQSSSVTVEWRKRCRIWGGIVKIALRGAENVALQDLTPTPSFLFSPVKYTLLRLLHGAGGSAAEVQSQLHTALDQEYISQGEFDNIYGQIDVVARQISRFITYLKGAG